MVTTGITSTLMATAKNVLVRMLWQNYLRLFVFFQRTTIMDATTTRRKKITMPLNMKCPPGRSDMEGGGDPMAAPFGGTWNTESSLSASDCVKKMEEKIYTEG